MFRNSEIARQMGRLRVPPGLLVQPQEIKNLTPGQVIVVLTGSQGEPMSALSRVAVNNHRWVSAQPDDDVVISARVIPGNEKAIFRMIDHLYRRGARVRSFLFPGATQRASEPLCFPEQRADTAFNPLRVAIIPLDATIVSSPARSRNRQRGGYTPVFKFGHR